jgi:hypothetical protein
VNRSLLAVRAPAMTDGNQTWPAPLVQAPFADVGERGDGEPLVLRDAVSVTAGAHVVRAPGERGWV